MTLSRLEGLPALQIRLDGAGGRSSDMLFGQVVRRKRRSSPSSTAPVRRPPNERCRQRRLEDDLCRQRPSQQNCTDRLHRDLIVPVTTARWDDEAMPETAQEYIARILSNSEGQDGLAVLGQTAGRLKALLDSSSPEKWLQRPAPGRWSAAEVLAHLADAEIVDRLARAVDPGQPTARRCRRSIRTRGRRRSSTGRSIPPSRCRRSRPRGRACCRCSPAWIPSRHAHHGLHAERGKETIAHLIQLYAGHDINHLKQIEALVGGGG